MILYFITFLSFFLFWKSLSLKPLPSWACEMRLLSLWFWEELIILSPISRLIKNSLSGCCYSPIPTRKMSPKKSILSPKEESIEEEGAMSVLDLPELVLDCILEKLPPAGLYNMAGVCSSLRDRCRNDHLWERHMKQKWGKLIGPAAYREWKCHRSTRKDFGNPKHGKQAGIIRILSRVWPSTWNKSKVDIGNKEISYLPDDSIMSWYLALQTGRFSFPAQVYNRENGHVGFMLSCYDAELRYDPRNDTFVARYPPHGRRPISLESNVPWERLRAPPVDTSPHDLHISDCLNDLRPGEHIEIQWRRNKEFPYGWWYGVVGHLESCDANVNYCRCESNEAAVLEFNQYTPGSRWRHTSINRKDHREEGNEADGFYGGIRRLSNKNEISTWKQLWPTDVLE